MKKGIRIVIAFILLAGVLFLARNQIALASSWPWQNTVAVQGQSASAGLTVNNNRRGSVKPPPVVAPPITKPGIYSLGGICIIDVEQLAEHVTLHAQWLPFTELHTARPEDTIRYLAGVCELKYRLSGKLIPDLTADEGLVYICFAPFPTYTSRIYVYDGEVWTALDTTDTAPFDTTLSLKCAVASKTGKYVLAAYPPTP